MKPSRFIVSMWCLCACAMVDLRASTQPVVAVYLEFDHAPSPVSLERMKQEAALIMKPAGLQLLWRDSAETEAHESFAHLVVIRFRGVCGDAPILYGTYAPEAQAAALASTAVSDGRVLPFSEVGCDEVRRYLEPVTRGAKDRDGVLGRALARVMAHEMYHMLLEERGHGRDGVARSYHRRDELVARTFRFHGREIEKLRICLDGTR